MWNPVLEVHNHHEQLPPHGRWNLLSASMDRTMVHGVHPARSDKPICSGVLVAANAWIIPVFKQYCRNSSPVYSTFLKRLKSVVLVGG